MTVLGSVVVVRPISRLMNLSPTSFSEDGEDSSVFLCSSGYCHTLISQIVGGGNLSIRRSCFGQKKEQQPREQRHFLFCFVYIETLGRYWDGMPGNRRVNHCYPVTFMGVRSTEVFVLLTSSSSLKHFIMFTAQCLCDYNQCNKTNGNPGLGLESLVLIVTFMMIRFTL